MIGGTIEIKKVTKKRELTTLYLKFKKGDEKESARRIMIW